jgi:hypothetical protein
MTHTYIRMQDGERYDVGQWLRSREGYDTFVTLFSVSTLKRAFLAVNYLNGGNRIAVEALQLEEKP